MTCTPGCRQADRHGTANSGVPANTTRRDALVSRSLDALERPTRNGGCMAIPGELAARAAQPETSMDVFRLGWRWDDQPAAAARRCFSSFLRTSSRLSGER